MGIIIEKASILCSAFTIGALIFGLDPMKAFAVGIIAFMPIRMFLGGKIMSQSGTAASLGAVVGFLYGLEPMTAFFCGVGAGYFYLYWWLFIFPKIVGD
ncbi:MAG: hypothetical protein ABIG20_02525 [archaeon]